MLALVAHAFEPEQVFHASDGIAQDSVGVVQFRTALQRKFLLLRSGFDEIIRVEFPAQLQKLLLQAAHFHPELAGHLEQLEIIDLLRELQEFPATRAEVCAERALVAAPADQRRIDPCCVRCTHLFRKPKHRSSHRAMLAETKKVAGGCGCQPLSGAPGWSKKAQAKACAVYAVKELPQPQFLAALGFWNTNPWRISVSSYSSVVPFRYSKLFGSTKIRAPCSSKTLSRARAWVSRRMA